MTLDTTTQHGSVGGATVKLIAAAYIPWQSHDTLLVQNHNHILVLYNLFEDELEISFPQS